MKGAKAMIGIFMLPISIFLFVGSVYFLAVAIPLWLGATALRRLCQAKFTKAGIAGILLTCWQLSVPADWEAVFGVLVGAGLLADIGKFVRRFKRERTLVELLPPPLPLKETAAEAASVWDGVIRIEVHLSGDR